MYAGYLELDTVVLVNAEATEAYVAHQAPWMALQPVYRTDRLHVANVEPVYRTPLLDAAQWANPADPSTHHFYGLYPISIDGLDDSTMSAAVVEYAADGGSIGLQRRASRSVRVSGLLVGRDRLSARAGLTWLDNALALDNGSAGGELRYFIDEPRIAPVAFTGVTGSRRAGFGSVATGTTIRYTWDADDGVDPAQPADATWVGAYPEGASIVWGRSDPNTGLTLEQFGPVNPIRRNYITNPSFRSGAAGWSVTDGTLVIQPAGGSDGGSYAALTAVTGTNGFGIEPFGSSNFGGSVPETGPQAGLNTATATMAAGPIVASIAVSGLPGVPVIVSLTTPSTTVIGSTTYIPNDTSWQRVIVQGTLASASTVTLTTFSTNNFSLDQALVESAAYDLGYFDGLSVVDGFSSQWVGNPDASASLQTWTQTAELCADDSNWRPYITLLAGSASAMDLVWSVRDTIDVPTQLIPYERRMYRVAATQGPQIVKEYDLQDQGYYIQVDFVLGVGNPSAYTLPLEVDTTPLLTLPFNDPVDVGDTSDDLTWISDPNAPVITQPPQAPLITNPTLSEITSWVRSYVIVPASTVADWASAVPILGITSGDSDINQVRVRFAPNPFGYAPQQVDPTSYCSEFILSYLPAVTRLEVNGVTSSVTASRGGSPSVSADHLLYGSNGAPIIWPELSCAISYVLTIDVPLGSAADDFSVDLQMRNKL